MADENVNNQAGVVNGYGDGGSANDNGLITPTADVDALEIDPATKDLSGPFVHAPWPRSGKDVPGNTAIRLPTGGVPPYRFSSSRPDIASVTAQGKVRGESNGQATITVQDANNMQASYQVNVSNVWRLHVMNTSIYFPWREARRVIDELGGTLNPEQSLKAFESLLRLYQVPFPEGSNTWVWANDSDSTGYANHLQGLLQLKPVTEGSHGCLAFVPAVPAF